MSRFRFFLPLFLLGAAQLGPAPASAANCDGEFCPQDPGCWDFEGQLDRCTDPPERCEVSAEPNFRFVDDQDGNNDGQLVALGNRAPHVGCGTLLVDVTGYYSIFDTELSESCTSQRDETGYLTVTNSCNQAGLPGEGNFQGKLIVVDSDNTNSCSNDGQCGAGEVCGGSGCCVPDEPTFMGTFLLVADEPNTVCLNHWCPEYLEEVASGNDPGFVTNGCNSSVNSIHFRVVEAIACEDTITLRECTFGCFDGQGAPDPCDDAGCPNFCKDGRCLDQDPCDSMSCAAGCQNGYCLPSSRSPGNNPADGGTGGTGGGSGTSPVQQDSGCTVIPTTTPTTPWWLALACVIGIARRKHRRARLS